MSVKVTSNKIVDFLLGRGMEVLKFVHCLELDNIQTVGKDTVRLALQQVLRFVCGDVRDSCEDICAMSSGAFHAVAMVDAAFSSFVIHVKVLQVIVEINTARTKIAAKQGRVGGEDGGDVDMALAT